MIEDPLAGLTIGRADGSFLIAEWADEGETRRERPIAPLHLHRSEDEDEAWYVLAAGSGSGSARTRSKPAPAAA